MRRADVTFAQRRSAAEPLTITVKLYDVPQRAVGWEETYDVVQSDTANTAQRVTAVVQLRAFAPVPP